MDTSHYRFVCEAKAIDSGTSESFEIDGRSILVCHTKEGFYAVEDLCSHAKATLGGGRLRGCRIICPLHGASFDVRDGSVKGKPASLPIRCYPLRVADGRIEVLLTDS